MGYVAIYSKIKLYLRS